MSIIDLSQKAPTAYVQLPLPETLIERGSISLEGEGYTIEFMFATKQEQWYISLWDKDSLPIILGKALLPETMVDVPPSSQLRGAFYLAGPTNGKGKWDTLKYDLSNNYKFFYIF